MQNYLKINCHVDDSQRIKKYNSIPDFIFDPENNEMDKNK